ncbi:NADPH-cytochrome P450 reductase [Aspergillus luchuensis]|uniref:NADPH-cytochrome P450 reductase n=1 Tax=Aspergillus kawachii TaxID=1069201 RepID=A0A146F436_ASPKA|nr:NADPH-cytochrome P450 reductase [Aspergillus luchuensis]
MPEQIFSASLRDSLDLQMDSIPHSTDFTGLRLAGWQCYTDEPRHVQRVPQELGYTTE